MRNQNIGHIGNCHHRQLRTATTSVAALCTAGVPPASLSVGRTFLSASMRKSAESATLATASMRNRGENGENYPDSAHHLRSHPLNIAAKSAKSATLAIAKIGRIGNCLYAHIGHSGHSSSSRLSVAFMPRGRYITSLTLCAKSKNRPNRPLAITCKSAIAATLATAKNRPNRPLRPLRPLFPSPRHCRKRDYPRPSGRESPLLPILPSAPNLKNRQNRQLYLYRQRPARNCGHIGHRACMPSPLCSGHVWPRAGMPCSGHLWPRPPLRHLWSAAVYNTIAMHPVEASGGRAERSPSEPFRGGRPPPAAQGNAAHRASCSLRVRAPRRWQRQARAARKGDLHLWSPSSAPRWIPSHPSPTLPSPTSAKKRTSARKKPRCNRSHLSLAAPIR
ncbi:MAG: hypothetical protein OJF49_002964 [Ktedonobacterales bacterium]|nr:MAG: hypothetical protein OJF49_002964 [Ktedonobacterales bacterium]